MHPNKVTLENLTLENLRDLFTFTYSHPLGANTVPKHKAISAAAYQLAKAILENAPECADRTAAIRLLTQVHMQAIASFAADPDSREKRE